MLATAFAVRSAYDVALENFDLAADALDLNSSLRAMIKYPERILEVSVPVRMDKGQIVRYQGFRVQHSTSRGPAKGGIRFHPQVTYRRSESAGYLDDLEVRGGQYPIWRRKGRSHLQPERNVDRGTGAAHPALHERHPAVDRPAAGYSRTRRLHQSTDHGLDHGHLQHDQGLPDSGVVTGKPLSLGGSLGRNEATGRGVFYTVASSCEQLGIPVKGARVVVQGFGNAGSSRHNCSTAIRPK